MSSVDPASDWCFCFSSCNYLCNTLQYWTALQRHSTVHVFRICINWSPDITVSWWRNQMEALSVLPDLCARNSPVTGEFPSQGPEMGNFNVLKKRLSKHSSRWWFKTQLCSLWRHCNVLWDAHPFPKSARHICALMKMTILTAYVVDSCVTRTIISTAVFFVTHDYLCFIKRPTFLMGF